ncbi:glutaredoxin-C6 [Tanacetum coccineum]
MQGVTTFRQLQLRSDAGVRLELTPSSNSPLAIDISESTEMRIQRLISENPVIIFSRPSCCMCHVMRRLFSSLGVHPTVIELDEDEIKALQQDDGGETVAPAVFIGGERIGGLESLVGLHLSGHLVQKLIDVGAQS